MSVDRTIETTITGMVRRQNSDNGNPRYRIITEHGSFLSKPDTGEAYSWSEHLSGPVVLTVDGNGNVWKIEETCGMCDMPVPLGTGNRGCPRCRKLMRRM